MALNIETFKTRSLTAILFVLIMSVGLLVNEWAFLLLFTIIHFGCWQEYQKLMGMIDKDYHQISPFHKYGVMLAGLGFMLWQSQDVYAIGPVLLKDIGCWLLVAVAVILPVTEMILKKGLNEKVYGFSFIGFAYISLSLGLMINLRTRVIPSSFGEVGWVIPIVLIVSIWINDTMAYMVGSFIGKRPLSKISPKKTWEGTIGGAILAVAGVTFLAHLIFELSIVSSIIISSIAVITGTLGDLFESKLKRMAGVKDSGNIMPGHGGFLDRFDSLLLATPFVWLYVIFLMK